MARRIEKDILDIADSIFTANFCLGYFRYVTDAPQMMRLQKIEDLKQKNLWNGYQPEFINETIISLDNPDFGINIYAVGAVRDNRSKTPEYSKLLDLTSTHINFGGHRCCDFVCTLTNKHNQIELIEDKPPSNEFVLGFIRLDSGVLNNGPLIKFLEVGRLEGRFANAHLLSGKVIVPTQNFGSVLRGGKLLALIAASNELKDWWNKRFNTTIAVFYTMSLYGSSKESSVYEQLDRFIKFQGLTESANSVRMKDPHKSNLIEFMSSRGIDPYEYGFKIRSGSNKADTSSKNLVEYICNCVWRHSKNDETAKLLYKSLKEENELWDSTKKERKRTYVSTYGFDDWRDNLTAIQMQNNEEYNLDNLFRYWKTKVFKKKDWGLRKVFADYDKEIHLRYDLLNAQLKNPDFEQVR